LKVSGLLSNCLEEYKFDDKLFSNKGKTEIALNSKLNVFKVEKLEEYPNKGKRQKSKRQISSIKMDGTKGKSPFDIICFDFYCKLVNDNAIVCKTLQLLSIIHIQSEIYIEPSNFYSYELK
jgi:hypothetical protein